MSIRVFLLLAGLIFPLIGCVDLSMYDQSPAPVGRPGEAPVSGETAQTWPLESTGPQEVIPTEQTYESTSVPSASGASNPAVVALLDGAEDNRRAGRYDLAASSLERAIRISPRDPLLWNRLAQVRLDQQKPGLAESLAKKSNLLAEGDRQLQYSNWLLIAEARKQLGDQAGAAVARQKADQL